jgi:predicted ArsR family transcriptional regulator
MANDTAPFSADRVPSRDVLKALGDNTRYAIYLELARSSHPLATAEIAETLELHPNTVRPHLERMREVGLLEVETEARGAVGRPQHRYAIAAEAPTLGLEPATFRVLARMLLRLATSACLSRGDAVEAGREQGAIDASGATAAGSGDVSTPAHTCVAGLVARLDALGFDPAVVDDDGHATVAFTHCPFRELAESDPDVVCGLHRGLVEGFVDAVGGAQVEAFHTLTDRTPCRVDLALVSP